MHHLLLILMSGALVASSASCRITTSVINGEVIQKARIVNEQGEPLSASFHPGTPAPFSGPFNFTNKNGYILINPNVSSCVITSEGYHPFKAPTKDFPKTVVMKRLSTKNLSKANKTRLDNLLPRRKSEIES